jgi:hypothetical protein
MQALTSIGIGRSNAWRDEPSRLDFASSVKFMLCNADSSGEVVMLRAVGAILLLASAQAASAAGTNFGIRTVGGAVKADESMGFGKPEPAVAKASPARSLTVEPTPGYLTVAGNGSAPINLGAISGIGARWGRVTSTYRSPAHNRRVGGVANSYHLRSRAIDIARRPGVSHWQIAAAFRNAGYHLVESLDEGDHSHFAFGNPGERKSRVARPQMVLAKAGEVTEWRIVYVGSGGRN